MKILSQANTHSVSHTHSWWEIIVAAVLVGITLSVASASVGTAVATTQPQPSWDVSRTDEIPATEDGAETISFSYDGAGRLTLAAYSSGSISYTYNANGDLGSSDVQTGVKVFLPALSR